MATIMEMQAEIQARRDHLDQMEVEPEHLLAKLGDLIDHVQTLMDCDFDALVQERDRLRTALETIYPYVRDKKVTGRKPLKDGIYTLHIGQIVRDALGVTE